MAALQLWGWGNQTSIDLDMLEGRDGGMLCGELQRKHPCMVESQSEAHDENSSLCCPGGEPRPDHMHDGDILGST